VTGAIAVVDGGRTCDLAVHFTPITSSEPGHQVEGHQGASCERHAVPVADITVATRHRRSRPE
jgi:hypothetical protein